jgi:hypothetical protein
MEVEEGEDEEGVGVVWATVATVNKIPKMVVDGIKKFRAFLLPYLAHPILYYVLLELISLLLLVVAFRRFVKWQNPQSSFMCL